MHESSIRANKHTDNEPIGENWILGAKFSKLLANLDDKYKAVLLF